jgi:hypothetical protein
MAKHGKEDRKENPDASKLHPVPSNESADSTSSPNEVADDSWQTVEGFRNDYQMEESEMDLSLPKCS